MEYLLHDVATKERLLHEENTQFLHKNRREIGEDKRSGDPTPHSRRWSGGQPLLEVLDNQIRTTIHRRRISAAVTPLPCLFMRLIRYFSSSLTL
jgi:hypothetical protein